MEQPAANAFAVFKGHNYRVLQAEGFDRIVFGCPPGMVKDFAARGEPLPKHYVIPIRTFIRGRNNFDFEFIIYSFLFENAEKERISIYCTRDQKKRFQSILYETLFGPRFIELLRPQFHRYLEKRKLNPKDRERMDALLNAVATDRKLFNLYKKNLKSRTGDKNLEQAVAAHLNEVLKKHRWLKNRKLPRFEKELAANYLLCAQLKMEMELFSLAEYKDREKFLDNLIDFIEFDRGNAVVVAGDNRRQKMKIVQVRPSAFDIEYKKETVARVDISHLDPPKPLPEFQLIEKPFMGVTFLGVGSGFTPKRRNSCLIAWSEGKGIMVDSLHDSLRLALHHGISENDIHYIFLSHVHSDHDTGIAEILLTGQRAKIISTRIIFESFLRKMVAVTCFPFELLEKFIDFYEVEPGKKTRLPGFENTWFTFDYSLHSIPAGRFQLTYVDPSGKETRISHSGDTKYDVEMVNQWHEQGYFTEKRRDAILGFVWDADCIIHDVGGGSIHTKLKSLDHLDDAVVENLILVHQHYDPEDHPRYRYASEGETLTLIPGGAAKPGAEAAVVKQVHLFKGLKDEEVLNVINQSEMVNYQADEIVFSQGDVGDDFFVILEGFAEIIIDGRPYAFYEKGEFFGELAVNTRDPRRRATIKAKSPLTLLQIPSRLYKVYNLPQIQDNFYKIRNYFCDVMPPSLIASLAFGRIMRWSRDDRILSEDAGTKETHIILSGEVEVRQKDSREAVLSQGDVMGEAGSLLPVTARAVTDDVYTIRMNAAGMKRIYKMFPSFEGTVYQKMKKLADRLS